MVPTKDMLDQIAKEEAELVLDQFTEEDAWELGCLMVEEAKKRQARIAIDIRRPGQIMFHAALAGATPCRGSSYSPGRVMVIPPGVPA